MYEPPKVKKTSHYNYNITTDNASFFVTYKSYNILLLKKGVWQLCLLPTITVEFCNVLGCQLHNSIVHLIFRSPFVVMILAKCQ